jgi:arylsulfatase A-like enzyme
MLGDHYLWHKIMPYEPSARVPLLVRAPKRFDFRPGTVIDAPVCLADIMPTCLDLAGAPAPAGVEGRSLVPFMRGETPAWREFLHLEHAPFYHALTDGREKYVWFAADGREQFFRLADDPAECRDLAGRADEAGRLAAWRRRLAAELAGRPEGFSDGERLVPGRPYLPVIERPAS